MDTLVEFIPDIVFRQQNFLWLVPIFMMLIPALYGMRYRALKKILANKWFAMHATTSRLPKGTEYIKKAAVLTAVLVALSFASAEPERKIVGMENIYNVRVTFLFDSSPSMKYAADVSPTRLHAAKTFVKSVTLRLKDDPVMGGNYQFALIPFAGNSIPLYTGFTTELGVFLEMLAHVDERTVTVPGTDLYAVLWGYGELLKKFPAPKEGVVDIAVLISDGGKEENIYQDRNEIAKTIRHLPKSVVMYTIGVGSKETDRACAEAVRKSTRVTTENSDTIAETIQKRCSKTVSTPLVRENDDAVKEYVRENEYDSASKILTSELDEGMLSFVARADNRGGEYLFFENSELFIKKISTLILQNRKIIGVKKHERYESAAVFFLAPAFLLFCLFFLDGWTALIVFQKNMKSRVFKSAHD